MTKHLSEPLRILLVNAINPNVEVESRYPGLGLAYLVSSVRKELPEANIEFRISDSAIIEEIESFRPKLVGISSVSQNFNIAKKYAEFCENQGIPVIMGGIHVSELPECLPGSTIVACRHEGEHTFVKLIKAFLDEKFSPEFLTDIPGISFWKNGLLTHNEDGTTIEDMDQLPMPARDLLNIRSHTYMFTSRGCPYRCAFCASTRFWSQLRFFSAEYVVHEIESLVRDYKVNMISFFDDLFIANTPRLEEIIRLLDKRQLLGKVRYTCSCRANMIDNQTVQLLSKMGVVSVGMGLESGDDETLQFLKGKSAKVTKNTQAINILKKAKIAVNGSFVIGSPQETREQIMRTYDFIRHSKLDLFDIYLLTPYPGTPIWAHAVENNLVSNNMADWSCLDVNIYRFPERAIILSEILDRKEVIDLYKKFRRLRFRRNLRKVVNHPMMRDVPRMSLNLLREVISKRSRPQGRGKIDQEVFSKGNPGT
jgi:radical SAM superfamily enzyme YgiQ (UPF0313 family)